MTNNYRKIFAACTQTQSGASGPALRRPSSSMRIGVTSEYYRRTSSGSKISASLNLSALIAIKFVPY
jgi:hypothetical protein